MWTVSQDYEDIIAGDNHYFEYSLCFGDTQPDNGIREESLFSLTCEYKMFNTEQPSVSGCLSAELNASMLLPDFDIPRMAKVRPYVRVANNTQHSEWIPQGVFYIDTRTVTANNDDLDTLTIHAYDTMMKTEADYPSTSHDWPMLDIDVVEEIAGTIGVGIDSRTYDVLTKEYEIGLPAGYSMREVLSSIAAMYAGNWVMNYAGELLFIMLNGIPAETNLLIDHGYNPISFGYFSEDDPEEVTIRV